MKLTIKTKIQILICIIMLATIALIWNTHIQPIWDTVFVILFFAILIFAIEKFLQPIKKLAMELPEEVRNVIGITEETKEQDEVMVLSDLFSKMIEQTRKRKNELEAHYQLLKEQTVKVKELDRSLEKKVYDLFTLFEVAKELNATLEPEAILKTVVLTCMAHLGVNNTSLLLQDNFIDLTSNGEFLIPAIIHGLDENLKFEISLKIDSDFVRFVKQQNRPVTKTEIEQLILTEDEVQQLEKLNFSLCAPLIVKDEIKGIIFLGSKKVVGQEFSRANVELLTILIGLAALALENARLYTMAITDGLTKIYTHRYFQIRLKEEIQRSRRYKYSLSLMIMDVDHFKEINDTYGHLVGNKALTEIAKISKLMLRTGDVLARYGGEEFAIILPESDEHQAYIVAERLREKIANHKFVCDEHEFSVTVSLGVAGLQSSTEKEAQFIEYADKALYKAKEEGRNRTCVYETNLIKERG